MRRKLFFHLIFVIINLAIAQKCLKVQDSRNVSQIFECVNVLTMNDIASEINSDWSYVRIVNRVTHTQFSNAAGNQKHDK